MSRALLVILTFTFACGSNSKTHSSSPDDSYSSPDTQKNDIAKAPSISQPPSKATFVTDGISSSSPPECHTLANECGRYKDSLRWPEYCFSLQQHCFQAWFEKLKGCTDICTHSAKSDDYVECLNDCMDQDILVTFPE